MAEQLTVRMPALSATMEEGELVRWIVGVGDTVQSGQPIAEVVTDKVDMELESPYDGVVAELVAEPGTAVRVGAPVALVTSESADLLGGLGLDGNDASPGAPADAAPAEVPDARPEPEPQRAGGIVPAPPPVRRRARELGVDLAEVQATGSRGHVTPEDLDRFMARKAPAPAETPAPARDRREAVRAATARLMTASALVPQFVLHRRIDLSRAAERKQGRSWTTEIARALLAALREHPAMTARWNDQAGRVVPLEEPRLGLAVDTGNGLTVVGLGAIDRLQPAEADRHVREAAERARAGQLRPSDREGLTCSLSNLGGFGVDRFEALVTPPQASVLSVGRANDVPVVVDGRVRILRCIDVGLTVDHRVADGADGARLLATFADLLEG